MPLVDETRCYGKDRPPPAWAWRDALGLLPVYVAWLQARGRAAGTCTRYGAAMRRWWLHVLAGGDAPTPELLVAWFGRRRRRVGLAAINLELAAMRSWNTWAAQDRPGLVIPGLGRMKQRRPPAKIVRTVDAAQVAALLESISGDDWLAVRDRTLIALLFDSGLRSAELAGLALGDITQDGCLFVRGGKGGRDRIAPITARMQAELALWIQRRRQARPGRCRALFVTRHGTPLRGGQAVWAIVRRRTRGGPLAGISPKWLRAGMATALLRSGCPLPAVAEILGHAHLDSTMHYLGPDLSAMRITVARHPRSKRQHQEYPP